MATNDRLLIAQLDVSVRALERSMRKAGVHVDRTTQTMEKRWERMNRKVSQSSNQMAADVRRAIAGIAIGMAAREVAGYADAWTEAGNKIAAAGTPIEQSTERLKELSNTAIATRSSFEATSALYARLGIATENLTGKSYDLLKVTELINKATVAGGASGTERRSTVLQLSQALASGQLMGEELRSLRENAPLLMQALAAEFDTTIGKLKDLGAEGKLTAERVLDAIMNAETEIEDRFSKTNVTIGDSFTNLQTRIIEYIGQADDSIGATEKLTGAIMFVADNVEAFAEALVIAGAALTGALGAAAVVSVVDGLKDITKGAQGAAKAMALLRAVGTFMMGPAGIVMGVAALSGAIAALVIHAGKAGAKTKELESRLSDIDSELKAIADKADIPWEKIEQGARDTIDPVDEATRKLQELNAEMRESGVLARQNALNAATTKMIEAEQARLDALKEIDRIENKREFRRAGNQEQKARELEEAKAVLADAERTYANAKATRDYIFSDTTPDTYKPEKRTTKSNDPSKEREKQLKEAKAVLDELDSALLSSFDREREAAHTAYTERLKAMETLGKKGKELSDAQADAAIALQTELDRIDKEQAEAEAEKVKRQQDAVKKEEDLLQDALDARDRAADRSIAIALREFEARKKILENSFGPDKESQQRKQDALDALEAEKRLFLESARDATTGFSTKSPMDQRIADIEDARDAELALEQEKLETLADYQEEYEQRRIEIIQAAEDQITAIRMAALGAQLGAASDTFDSMAEIAKTFAGEQSGVYKTLFTVAKAFKLAETLVNAPAAAAEAIANSPLPYPLNLAAGAATYAAVMAQAANLRSVDPGFAQGVIGLKGPGTGTSDSINARLSAGESVITKIGTDRNRDILAMANQGIDVAAMMAGVPQSVASPMAFPVMQAGGASYSISSPITIQGSVDRDTMPDFQRELRKHERRIIQKVFEAQRKYTSRHERDDFMR